MPAVKNTTEKEQVRQVLDSMFNSICAKDAKGIASLYASDVIFYDCKPPFQAKGAITMMHIWEACLPYFPESFGVETRDVHVHANGELGVVHGIFRLKGTEKDHPAMQTWMRFTTVMKRQQSKWKIVHDHVSLPFNPHTKEALHTLDID